MMNLSAWILSVAGVAALTLMVDIILPEGETRDYIKSVFAVFTVFVIAAPLPYLLNGNLDFDGIFGDSQTVYVDYDFIDQMNESRIDLLERDIEQAISEAGYDGIATVIAQFDNAAMSINFIGIVITGEVIDDKTQHINIVKAVTEIAVRRSGVDEKLIKVAFDPNASSTNPSASSNLHR